MKTLKLMTLGIALFGSAVVAESVFADVTKEEGSTELIATDPQVTVTKKEESSSFEGCYNTDEEKINIIKEGIKIACQKKNSSEIYNLMLSISFFKLYDRSEFIEDYIKLAKEEFHEEHETIASYFQSFHLPQTIECIYELAISDFEKYRDDEYCQLVEKCCYALGAIRTEEAKEKLKLLAKSDKDIIREHVEDTFEMYKLS